MMTLFTIRFCLSGRGVASKTTIGGFESHKSDCNVKKRTKKGPWPIRRRVSKVLREFFHSGSWETSRSRGKKKETRRTWASWQQRARTPKSRSRQNSSNRHLTQELREQRWFTTFQFKVCLRSVANLGRKRSPHPSKLVRLFGLGFWNERNAFLVMHETLLDLRWNVWKTSKRSRGELCLYSLHIWWRNLFLPKLPVFLWCKNKQAFLVSV